MLGTTLESFGVAGTSSKASGVIGQTGAAPAFDPKLNYTAGVVGTSRDAIGVVAVSQNSFGVLATSQKRAAVSASSQNAAGVSAVSGTNFGVLGISGAEGPTLPAPFTGRLSGVSGSSQDSHGVIGASKMMAGVLGVSIDNPGVQGVSVNHVGVFGQATKSYAGFFAGDAFVTGTVTATVKNAVVRFPDGSQRLLHCMESPEHWFEDFGSAKLTGGRATVKLDADFAKTVKLNDYRVFVTPEGDCHGLYVQSKRAKSFEVRELQGGKSGARFSYRIVGKRKDITAHKRFAKIETRLPTRIPKLRVSRGRKAAHLTSRPR